MSTTATPVYIFAQFAGVAHARGDKLPFQDVTPACDVPTNENAPIAVDEMRSQLLGPVALRSSDVAIRSMSARSNAVPTLYQWLQNVAHVCAHLAAAAKAHLACNSRTPSLVALHFTDERAPRHPLLHQLTRPSRVED